MGWGFGGIELHAGDFNKKVDPTFCWEKAHFTKSHPGPHFKFTPKGQFFGNEIIMASEIESLEILTEDSAKKIGATIGWGIVGTLLAGPAGLVVGGLLGGTTKKVSFVCQFKDGRKFLGTTKVNTYTQMKAAMFDYCRAPSLPEENLEVDERIEIEDRILCRDKNCTGEIGMDGKCEVCGKPYIEFL